MFDMLDKHPFSAVIAIFLLLHFFWIVRFILVQAQKNSEQYTKTISELSSSFEKLAAQINIQAETITRVIREVIACEVCGKGADEWKK